MLGRLYMTYTSCVRGHKYKRINLDNKASYLLVYTNLVTSKLIGLQIVHVRQYSPPKEQIMTPLIK